MSVVVRDKKTYFKNNYYYKIIDIEKKYNLFKFVTIYIFPKSKKRSLTTSRREQYTVNKTNTITITKRMSV